MAQSYESYFSSDIQQLTTLYNRPQFSFVFLYGRQDTGRTRLVRDFCRGKRTLFFSARETSPARQLADFHREYLHALPSAKRPPLFSDWSQAFSFVAEQSSYHRLVLVLDEFHLMARQDQEFWDAFTHALHHEFQAGRVFLMVTASAHFARAAEEARLSDPGHPFHLVSARAALSSLPFYACSSRLSAFSPRDQILLYGVTGGLPSYLDRLRPDLSAGENILSLFFDSHSPLLSAPLPCLRQELREISTYNFLLELLACGDGRLADLAEEAGMGTNKCAKYLNTLIDMDVLRKEFPAAGEIKKKVRYVFADHMLRFWYRFVYPNISPILWGQGEHIYKEEIEPQLSSYLLPVFETVCGEYLERLAAAGQTPFPYRHTGSWWSGGTKREPFFRIPLVAMDSRHAVLGLCHWEKEAAGLSCLEHLTGPLPLFDGHTRYCCIFSASGFTDELVKAAGELGNVWLVDLEDMTSQTNF